MSLAELPLLAVSIPFAGAVCILAVSRLDQRQLSRTPEALSLLTSLILIGTVLAIYAGFVDATSYPLLVLAEPIDGLQIAFSIEPLGMLFSMVAAVLWFVTTLYASGYMRAHGESGFTRFYSAFSLAIGATIGIAYSANLFTLFIFYELLTISTWPLVVHSGTADARRGGRVYLGILLATSLGLFLPAIIYTWVVAGSVSFEPGGILTGKIPPAAVPVLYLLFVLGIGKAAVMPLHRWLPAAMVAPTPVSALLHAVAVVKAGVFTVLKVTVYIFGTDLIQASAAIEWLICLPAFTIIAASLIAMRQDNLKARLAYSTVSQLSYIVMAAMLANEMALVGGSMHIGMHAFAKITLFFAAGAILIASHRTKVSELDGLGRAMPITFGCFFVASLSIVGMPPLGGLWSKWYLGLGVIEAHQWLLLAVLVVSTLLNTWYLLAIPVRGFFRDPVIESPVSPVPLSCVIAMLVTSGICVVLFLVPGPVYELARMLGGAGHG